MVKVVSTEGVKVVPDEELSYHEHEVVIDHWEAIWTWMYESGRFDGVKYFSAMAKIKKAREALLSGRVNFKGKPE